MKSSLLGLALCLLTSCASVPGDVDVILDTTPEPAAAAGWLVGQLDISTPVLVEDGELLELGRYGQTVNLGPVYVITLDYRLEPAAKVMVLLHELAHVLVSERGQAGPGHGPEWGEAYAEVFRAWVQEST